MRSTFHTLVEDEKAGFEMLQKIAEEEQYALHLHLINQHSFVANPFMASSSGSAIRPGSGRRPRTAPVVESRATEVEAAFPAAPASSAPLGAVAEAE